MPARFDDFVDITLEIGFASDPTVSLADTLWTDVSTDLMAHDTQGPNRNYLLDRFEGGSAAFVLDNRSGDYDPNNPASPHVEQVLPFKRVRFSATTATGERRLFTGFAESWTQQWPQSRPSNDGIATTELRCVDATRLMALLELPDSPWAWEVSQHAIPFVSDPGVGIRNVAWYRLGESEGATQATDSLADFSGDNFHGLYQGEEGGPKSVGSLVFKSPDNAHEFNNGFDGGTRVSIPAVITDYPFSVSMFINIPPVEDATGFMWLWGGFLVREEGAEQFGDGTIHFIVRDDGLASVFADDGPNTRGEVTSTPLDDGETHLLQLVCSDASTYRIYVDGADQTDPLATVTSGTGQPSMTTIVATADVWRIGAPKGISNPAFALTNPWIIDEVLVIDSTVLDPPGVHVDITNAGLATSQAPAWSDKTTGEALELVLTNTITGMGLAAADVDIDTGTPLQPHTLGGTVLDYAERLTVTEFGGLYVRPGGMIRFRDRQTLFSANQHTVSQITFGDGVGELPYASAEAPFDESLVRNDVTIARDGGAERRAKDQPSVNAFGPHGFKLTDLLHQSDGVSADYANFVIQNFAQPQQRIEALEIRPQADPSALYDEVFDRALEDRVIVRRRPPGGHTTEIEALVQGVRHSGTAADRLWTTEYQLTRTGVAQEDYWLIGIVGRSEIGQTTVVGF